MKNRAGLLIPILLVLFLLIGCHHNEGGIIVNTTADATKGLSIKSGDSTLSVIVKDNSLYITELMTNASGKNMSDTAVNTSCSLPEMYCPKDELDMLAFEWQYDGAHCYTAENGEEGYIITFFDEKASAVYDMYITAHKEKAGPFEIYGFLKNSGEQILLVKPNNYFSAAVKGDEPPTAWTFSKEGWLAEGVKKFSGEYFSGTGIYKTKIVKNGVKASCKVSSTYSDPGSLPMMYIDYGDCGLYFAQEWSNGLLQARGTEGNGDLVLTAALEQYGDFSTYVNPSDSLFFPQIYLGIYDGDVDDGSNIFKHWFLEYKAPDCLTDNPEEPLTQYDYCLDKNIMQATLFCGFQALKLDYGWWAGERIDGVSAFWMREGLLEEGSHFANEMSAANLKDLCDKAKKIGSTVTLYYLPRDTMLDREGVPTSIGKYGHPEWFSNIKINSVNASADFGNVECVKFFQEYMTKFFSENGVTTWRSDFEPICSDSDKVNRHKANGSDVQYWCTVGFGELVDYLYENVDGFRYESCSSGGMMKDLFTVTKAVVINCDDSSDYNSLHASFYDSSYVFHPAQLQLPCGVQSYTQGGKYYTGTGDYLYGLRCSLTGGVMIGKWESNFDANDKATFNYYIKTVYNEKMKPLIREGNLYHILPRPDGINWDGLEYVDADTDREIKGLVMLWKPTDKEGDSKTIKLRGLKADVSYQLTFEDRTEQNCVMTGYELMNNGLIVTISEDMGSEMIWISEKA